MENFTTEYDASGTKLKKIDFNGETTEYEEDEIYVNDGLYQTSHDEGRIVNGVYEYNITDHLENLRVAFKDSLGIAKITQVNAYGAFGDELPTLKYINSTNKNRFGFNLKEEENDFGIGYNDFKWRFSDQILGRFFTIDRLAEKYSDISTYQFASNDPINKVEIDGLEGIDADNPYVKAYLSKNVQEKVSKANSAGERSFSITTSVGPQVGISVKKGNVGLDVNANVTLQSKTNSSKTNVSLTGGANASFSIGENSVSLGKVDATIGNAEIKNNKSVMSINPDITATGVTLPSIGDLKISPINTSGSTTVNQYTNLSNGLTPSSSVDANNFTFGVSLGAIGSQITTNFVQMGDYIKNTTSAIGAYFGNLIDIYTNPQKYSLPDEKRKK